MNKTIVLLILDGWGYRTSRSGNPILEGKTPIMEGIASTYPWVLLQASGLAVGMNWGDFGNSEVGHINIGAGRTVPQYQARIANSIKDGSFFQNPAFVGAFQHDTVHIVGLLTSGAVHADYSHILALIDMAKSSTAKSVFLHLFTDGKDSGLQEGGILLKKLQTDLTTRESKAQIASIIGRNFAMDRDNNWELTAVAHDAIAKGVGTKTEDFSASLQEQYAQGVPDTKIPALIHTAYPGVQAQDALVFFNFREDSIRQLYRSFAKDNLALASMTQYFEDLPYPFAFSRPEIKNNLAETISTAGLQQFHIAETLKYAHVTYFFDGLRNTPYPGETNVLIDSVKKIEEEPTMGAMAIAERVVAELDKGHSLIVANFANADMLAHTGNYEATIKGVETIDTAIGVILDAILAKDNGLVITSDHGNAETLIDRITNEAESKHGGGPVPCYVIGKEFKGKNPKIQKTEKDISGMLGDVAPTVLELMGLPQPSEMTGKSLLPELLGQNT